MTLFVCAVITLACLYYVFFFPGEVCAGEEKTRSGYLRERKEAVYENLRDLNPNTLYTDSRASNRHPRDCNMPINYCHSLTTYRKDWKVYSLELETKLLRLAFPEIVAFAGWSSIRISRIKPRWELAKMLIP